ncbi:hypothetical protein LTS15_010344 [Exophiala xenobiotica]|nr:hypothetical protein LTS15_010344 [Exophiala xenobiotica]
MAQHHPGLGDLIRLPREVRELIYEHYFAGALVYQVTKDHSSPIKYVMPNMDKGLLDVSKAIRKEAETYQHSNITLSTGLAYWTPPEHLCRAASTVIVDCLEPKHRGFTNDFLPFDAQRYKNLTTLHIRYAPGPSKCIRGCSAIKVDGTKIKQYLQSGDYEHYILEAIREKWILFEDPLPVVNYHGPGLMVRTTVMACSTVAEESGCGLDYEDVNRVDFTLVGKPWRIECITYVP